MKLPRSFKIGFETIEIEVLPAYLSYDVSQEEASFHPSLRKIFISEEIVRRGGPTLINTLIHELLHVAYWYCNLTASSSEEDVVNAMSNYITELMFNSELLTLITKEKSNVIKSQR